MKTKVIILLLTLFCLALSAETKQEKEASKPVVIPELSAAQKLEMLDYQLQYFQDESTITNLQKQIDDLHKQQNEIQFAAAQKAKEILKAVGLDDAKYAIKLGDHGVKDLSIIEIPKPTNQPGEDKKEKK